MDNRQLLEYWQMALVSPLGIELYTNNPASARAQLYKARQEAQDADLQILVIRACPKDPEHHLWIVKQGKVNVSDLEPLNLDQLFDNVEL